MNGGTCIDGVDNFTCSCPPKLTGPLCECLILDDESYDCEYVSPTPLTSSTQSVLTTLMEATTSAKPFYTDMSSSYLPSNGTTPVFTTDGVNIPTNVIGTSTQPDTDTTVSMEITTEENTDMSNIPAETTVVSESTTTKAGISELPEHEETRPTIESDNSKTEVTTECRGICNDTFTRPQSSTEKYVTTSSTESTKFDIPTIIPTKEMTKHTTLTTSTEATAEIPTTPNVDISTDQMFTDIPTDRPVTDIPVGYSSTTEAMEVTSGFDTETLTTMQSECTNSICNEHGSCINTPHGIRVRKLNK